MKETFYQFDTPVKICLLADIHDRPFDEIQTSLIKQKPDIIAVAGDIIERVDRYTDRPVILQPQYSLPFLKMCAQTAPTFFSLGNHEWMLQDLPRRELPRMQNSARERRRPTPSGTISIHRKEASRTPIGYRDLKKAKAIRYCFRTTLNTGQGTSEAKESTSS